MYKNIFAFLLLTFILSCGNVKVFSDFDKSANFNKYQTFSFFDKGIENLKISDIEKGRLLNSITKNLDSIGIKKSQNPDFLVNIKLDASKEIYINNPYHYYYSPYYYYWSPIYPVNFYSTRINGELIIDIIDNYSKKLVWQGIGSGHISMRAKNREKLIDEFISKILKNYPN